MSHTPRHAIREHIASMQPTDLGRGGAPMPFRLLPETVRLVKNIGTSGRYLSYVTVEADEGGRENRHWSWTVQVTQEEPGRWIANGVAGGSGHSPVLGRPWANLGGNWGRHGFLAGGPVEDAGKGVDRVRMTDAEGRVFEDTVDEGIVLFMSAEPAAMPMRVDLYDADGQIVATDDWGFKDE